MNRPNFICIGTQKAGTTTLADILKDHPQVCVPVVKETKFFLFEEEYEKGLDYYLATHYPCRSNAKAIGEFDPDYIMSADTAFRLRKDLGNNLKLIVVLRDPAKRAYSHFLMSRKKGLEKAGFEEAMERPSRIGNELIKEKAIAYKERGMYADQLKVYLDLFPQENFLFLLFEEDIVQALPDTILRIQQFLGLEEVSLNTDVLSNEAGEARNEMMRDIVRRPNPLKKGLKFEIDGQRIRKNLIQRNMRGSTIPKPPTESFSRINSTIYAEQIREVARLTGLDTTKWC